VKLGRKNSQKEKAQVLSQYPGLDCLGGDGENNLTSFLPTGRMRGDRLSAIRHSILGRQMPIGSGLEWS